MPDLVKTWPAFMPRYRVIQAFSSFADYYFTLGPRKPKQEVKRLFYTHRGELLGNFDINRIVQNDGTNIPKLHSISGEESEWQIKPDHFVAICDGPFIKLWVCATCRAPIAKLNSAWTHIIQRWSLPACDSAAFNSTESRVFHEPFRGWHYFELQEHLQQIESRIGI